MSFLRTIIFFSVGFLCPLSMWGQVPANDNCVNAIQLCSGVPVVANNQNATLEVCAGCADGATTAGNFCFDLHNTVWFFFETNNIGGVANVTLSGFNCNGSVGFDDELQGVVVAATNPCNEATYTLVSNCASSNNNLVLTATTLNPNTTYYVMIDGDLNGTGITDAASCAFTIEVAGPAVEQPDEVTLTSSTTDACENEVVTLTAETPDCDDNTYSWYANGQLLSTGPDSTFSFPVALDVSVSVEAVCNNTTCKVPYQSDTIDIAVEEVSVDAGSNQIIVQGESVTLSGTGDGALLWSPSQGLSTTSGGTTVASPEQTTTYFLTATTANGCQDVDEVVVRVIEPIVVPNTITPNGDGQNDTWEIIRIQNYESAKVSIYDRWGQRIYHSIGYDNANGWDARFLGKALPPSTYYYIIDLNRGYDGDIFNGFIEVIY